MSKYEIHATRKTAARYFAWEFGIRNAVKMMKTAKTVAPGFVAIEIETFLRERSGRHTKRAAEGHAARIRQVNAFQAGRLGVDLNSGDVYVRTI